MKKFQWIVFLVCDNVSGKADGCHKFAEFLAVCWKYIYHCIYVFHIIAQDSWVWKKNCHKLIFLIFFPQVCHTRQLLKFYRAIVDKQQKNMSLSIQCGWVGFLLTLLIPTSDIAQQLTVVEKIKTVQIDIQLRTGILKKRFAIVTNHMMMSYTMFS